ncbi:hypothetical protein F4561_005598 [Lipingzhangella halophila]|uniref:Uncharacterized protein n=1 Tax=Lipingzhangella halophila TaxID=1783352 RepID=A0A7W7RMH4_9ACTN|nr:hypothetical protein [Lipingzhangella halophila]MBB4934704.1 hypothetical protein [Lipingzhangella halophila]
MLRALLSPIIHSAPTCCGQPMLPGTSIGAAGGWICQVDPTHVRG